MRKHVRANCPSKNLGTKCFECGKFGHIENIRKRRMRLRVRLHYARIRDA